MKPVSFPARSTWLLAGMLCCLTAVATADTWDNHAAANPVRLGTTDFALDGGLEFIPLAPLTFEQARDTLSERDQRALDDMATFIRLVPGTTRVLIKGHAGRDDGKSADAGLSQRRAAAVRDYLIGRGVSAGLIQAAGYGSALPIDEAWTPEGRARNRRVEIYVVRRR